MRIGLKAIVAIIGLGLVLGACKKEEKKDTAEATANKLAKALGDKLKKAVDNAGKKLNDKRPGLPGDAYEKLIVGLAVCKLTDRGYIDYKCQAYKDLKAARSRNTSIKDFAGMSSKLGIKHLTHENATVRFYAAGLLKSFFGAKGGSVEAVLKAAPNEKNPFVLGKMIYAVGSQAKKNEDVAKFVMASADHAHAHVRTQALSYLAYNPDMPGVYEKFVEKIEKDADAEVRGYACRYAGRLEDERLLPLYKKLTKDAEKDPKLYAKCMRGLFEMWNTFLGNKKPSKKAYKLTLARMNDKPRTKNRPPWIMMSDFGRVPKSLPAWFKKKAVTKMLLSVGGDPTARWLARTGAVRALESLKAGDELKKLKKKLTGKTDFDNKNVLKAVERALAKVG